MGDKRRFDTFAKFIAQKFPDKNIKIADVAGGKGYLQLALNDYGYRNVVTFDKRYKTAIARQARKHLNYKYKWFNSKVKDEYDLIVGLHPDEATDHIIIESCKRNIPFVICPCCVKPDAVMYNDRYKFNNWYNHLKNIAHKKGYDTRDFYLKISGRNKVMIGKPVNKG